MTITLGLLVGRKPGALCLRFFAAAIVAVCVVATVTGTPQARAADALSWSTPITVDHGTSLKRCQLSLDVVLHCGRQLWADPDVL